MEFDILVVGGGPAGLSAAIKAKQTNEDLNICVVEKGGEIGSHILSGNIFEPTALNELYPNWKEMGPPLNTPVTDEAFYFLPNGQSAIKVPNLLLPPQMHNHGNYVISLGELCKWLAEQAEGLGIEIYPGFAANNAIIEDGHVRGVTLQDVGIAKDGSKKDSFELGMELRAKQTLLTEGARGSISDSIMSHFNLREGKCPQAYGFGLKEVWQIPEENHRSGLVTHTFGWPLEFMEYGGSFIYHMKPNLIHMGLIIGLDYKNPHMSPYNEFQRFKHHPRVEALLEGGECISYGARVVNEGGFQSIPKVTFPGGMLAGCSAGFLNMPKIKGSHNAMKTGMMAGECAAKAVAEGRDGEVTEYQTELENSWVWEELKVARNVKPSFKAGIFAGTAYTGTSLLFMRGKEPWTFKWSGKDCDATKPAATQRKRVYEKPDGVISFDLLDNLIRSGVNHEEDQPKHLKIKEGRNPVAESLDVYDGPEGRFCPAKVYEYVDDPPRLNINAQNCLHCKCCSIKTPHEFINWTVPEGGGGPQYAGM